MLTRSDWDTFVGPNEFFAAEGDRILHQEIPEQAELFWEEFLAGRNGSGFAKIDVPENRAVLLDKYRRAYGANAPIVRSALNDLWRKFVVTHSAFDHGFIAPGQLENEEVVDPAVAEAERLAEYAAFSDSPETSVKMIAERRRTDRGYAEYYNHRLRQEVRSDNPMQDINARNNLRQPSPSTMTPTSRKTAPADVQRFAVEYVRLSTEQIKRLLSPALNPNGPADAARQQQLFNDAIAYGLL